jgi:uncharacterized repeat protein (TIGR01451 family)
MRIAHSLLALALAAVGLLFVRQGVTASPGFQHLALAPQQEAPFFTRIATVTIASGAPLTPALSSYWESLTISFPVGISGTQFIPPNIPSDASDVTAFIVNGTYTLAGTIITFNLQWPSSTYYYAYRTNQRVALQGNQYQVNVGASANAPFLYTSTLIFTAPYQFVGYTSTAIATIDTNTLRWGLVVPQNDPPFNRFRSAVWLADSRVARPDIEVVTASQQLIDPGAYQPAAHVTAVLRNNGTLDTGAPALIALYDRSAPIPPAGPLDDVDTWCSTGPDPQCPASATFTNPVPSLAPGETITLTTNYTFTRGGLRHLYLQADTFGGSAGLNAEFNEANNQIGLGQIEVPLADLSMSMDAGPAPVFVGALFTYTLHITNAGPDTANGVTMTDQLPNGVIFRGAAGNGWTCGHAGSGVTCTTGVLSPTANTILISVTAPSAAGLITNTASITSTSHDWLIDGNTASLTIDVLPAADLSLTTSARPYPGRSGQTLTYTLNTVNAGPSAATFITITDQLPGNVTFGGAWGSGWICSDDANIVTCIKPNLGVTADTVFITVTTPPATGVITSTASITATTIDPRPVDNVFVFGMPVKALYPLYLPLALRSG